MAFPEPRELAEDEATFYASQLTERIASGHRSLSVHMCDPNTEAFAAMVRQVEALGDLLKEIQAKSCLDGKLLLLMHGYYGVPLHPRHRLAWQQNIENAVDSWFLPASK